jgi:hypothetical protein
MSESQKETYKKLKDLVNMSASELKRFMDSDEGKKAGLSRKEAKQLGIHYGRESARWILKMKDTPVSEWTPKMWEWANRQISFNSRMRGNKGKLYDEKGKKTRKHLSLLIWGHNPTKYKDGGEVLLAPNGKPSNLTPEQYRLVRTPAFKNWFGDWENSPETASKVIDKETKEPLVVYHFTDKRFNVFEKKGLSKGFFFTENKKDEEFSYTKNPKSYFLSIKAMSEVSEVPNKYWSTPNYENEFIDKSKKGGGQGIQFIREIDNKRIIVAFEPNQIKLADGTNTTFDSNNPDIRYADGGSVGVIVKVIDEISTDEIDSKILKQFLDRKNIIKWLGYTYRYKKEKVFQIPDMHYDNKGNLRMFRYEKFYDIYEKTTKDSSGEIVNSGDIYFNKKTEDEIKEILLSFVKEDFKHRALAVASSEFNITQIGEPRILIIEDNQIIGVIFRSINQTSDYKFDIFIKENKRRLGYSKILLDAMLNDFIDNFPRDKQITAEVHNKELLKYIKDKYGFTCKNKKDYYGEDVVFYNLINESYYNVKDCVLTRQKVEKYLSDTDIRFSKGGLLSNDEKKETLIDSIIKIDEIENKLGRKLNSWNDDIVYLDGIKYKKVYLRTEYKRL